MGPSLRLLAGTIFSATCLLFAPPVHSQTQAPGSGSSQAQPSAPSPAPKAPGQSSNIPDQKLDAAAAALTRVAKLEQTYERQLQDADQADKQRIANEAENALVKAVTDHGLSVDEYNSIVQTAQVDPVVRNKILERMRASGE